LIIDIFILIMFKVLYIFSQETKFFSTDEVILNK